MLDQKYNALEKEAKWRSYWKENDIYKFDKNAKGEIYSIDTPPPTVNAKIHMGHIFGYSQKEMMARYKRIRGYNVFYPFGFDDNGLPTERLVEKEQGKRAQEIGREAFTQLCYETIGKYENEFKELFSRLGTSTDWDLCYQTISPEAIKISQLSFLELVEKGYAYRSDSPALWCNECLTSIAQAELETGTLASSFHYLNFKTEDNELFSIATTRPELIPAIVAVFIHPEDEKNKHLIGKNAIVPVVDIIVPIMADEKVQMDKGSGIVMCCTFGDQTDIEWWKKYNLPLKDVLTKDGFIREDIPVYGGMRIKAARKQIVEDFITSGFHISSENIEHEVQLHERCNKEIEYAVHGQWFIDLMNHKEDFLRIGDEINWHPKHMQVRYNEWVENIGWDWCISRQRYFGVPFPAWYCSCGEIVLASEDELPINPLTQKTKNKCSCGGELIPDEDVMDTWATSSVTPLINMRYKTENSIEEILSPMSLRPNGHDIIRTWDFYTIVKSFYHFGQKPWDNIMINGFVMAGKGEKLSKRKENSKKEPMDLINEYSADVVRYFAGSNRLGNDVVLDEETFRRGSKLVNKIWNVSKFIEMHFEDYKDKDFTDFEYLDKWILGKYQEMEKTYLNYLDEYEMGLGLNTLEKFFWNFCDNYIEIVKHRLYRPEEFGDKARYSGQKTVYTILYKLLQKFSVYFPFITEEIFQGIYANNKSIHTTEIELSDFTFKDEIKYGNQIVEIIGRARGEKTNNNVSLKTPIKNIVINVSKELEGAIDQSKKDLRATLFIENMDTKVVKDKDFEIKEIVLNLEGK